MSDAKKQEIINILSKAFGAIVLGIGRNIEQKYKNRYSSAIHQKNESYPFIPYTPVVAVEQLLMASDLLKKPKNIYNKNKFLDAGCGIGNIMLLAQKIGFIPYGLEIDPTIIRTAKKVNRQISHHIIKQNIMTYKKYGEYDVIYYFCPFRCDMKEEKFEEHIEDQMKVGAILIPNNKQSSKIKKDKRFRFVRNKISCRSIYVKKSK